MPKHLTHLQARETTWKLLLAHDYPLIWAPFMVDLALDMFPGADKVSSITQSPSFHEACAQRARGFDAAYGSVEWNRQTIESGTCGNRSLVFMFAEKMVGNLRKRLGLSVLDEERHAEYRSLIIHHIQVIARQYRVGKEEHGKVVDWGYEAYLTTFGGNMSFNIAKKMQFNRTFLSLDEQWHLQLPNLPGSKRTVLEYLEGRHPDVATTPCVDAAAVKMKDLDAAFDRAVIETAKCFDREVSKASEKSPGSAVYFLYMAGFGFEEIAKLLKIAPLTVRWRLKKMCVAVVDRVRELIAEELGVDPVLGRAEILGYLWGRSRSMPVDPIHRQTDLPRLEEALRELAVGI
jgi:hypothetical protein